MNCDFDYNRQALQNQAGSNNHIEFYSICELLAGRKSTVSAVK